MTKPRNPSTEIPLPGLKPYVEEFSATRKEELIALKELLAASDFEGLRKQAHTWKGFAVPYGFGELGYLSIELEFASENQNLEACQLLVQEIELYLSSK